MGQTDAMHFFHEFKSDSSSDQISDLLPLTGSEWKYLECAGKIVPVL